MFKHSYIGISPSGKASDSDSDIVGSNPAIPAKKSASTFVLADFLLITYYLLLFHYSLEFYVPIFRKVISNSEKRRSEVQTRFGEFEIFSKCVVIQTETSRIYNELKSQKSQA